MSNKMDAFSHMSVPFSFIFSILQQSKKCDNYVTTGGASHLVFVRLQLRLYKILSGLYRYLRVKFDKINENGNIQ